MLSNIQVFSSDGKVIKIERKLSGTYHEQSCSLTDDVLRGSIGVHERINKSLLTEHFHVKKNNYKINDEV
jgi:hypothetical protein